MKKKKNLLRNLLFSTAVTGLVMLTACGDSDEPSEATSGGSQSSYGSLFESGFPESTPESAPETTPEPEDLPASQEYVTGDGAYRIVLLEDLTQTDVPIQAGTAMMELDGGSVRTGFSCIFLGCSKLNIPGNPEDVENLADYGEYMTDMFLNNSGVTVDWEDTDAPAVEGAEQCIARKGTARMGVSRGLAYICHAESADSYLTALIVGNNDDVEEAMQVVSLAILDESAAQAGTGDFINSMTAVLDAVNGANLRETYKMLADMGADEEQLEALASQARQSLSGSWGIEDTDGLLETADWLMGEGHNREALELLTEAGGTDAADRDTFEAALSAQGLEEETCIYLLAAYDAWSAYGEGAIAAWDLSRVGTIMGFGYAAGYCTYEEAMDKMLEAAQMAQQLFGSWEDFNKSYLYGYSYWAEESLEDPASSAAERAELINGMESRANGPFSIDWNMELKKEW